MKKNIILKDLIYFDFSKAVSIWSQIEEGLIEKVSISEEHQQQTDAGGSIGIPKLAEAKLGSMDIEKKSILETKVLHHDLLNRLELKLRDLGLLVELNEEFNPNSVESIRGKIDNKPYVLSEGWTYIEDYNRLENITSKFNEFAEFISKCSLQTIKQSDEYLVIQKQIDDFKEQIKSERDRNNRAKLQAQVKVVEANINKMLKPQIDKVDDWLLNGIQMWVSNFSPNRIQFRLYPYEEYPSFCIISNLKRDCFVDLDLEHLLFGYGYKQNIKLSIFGIITSLPPESTTDNLLSKEYEELKVQDEKVVFERAFRNMFAAFDGIEEFMRFSRYPNIILHPIAVFRNIIGTSA